MTGIRDITPDEFDQLTSQSGKKILVDFYAPWCAPCKMIAPLLERLAEEEPSIEIVKVNTDKHPELMSQMGIRGIPTLLRLEDGELKNRTTGALNYTQLSNFMA